MERPSSNLYEGYRSVGHVTGPQPFIVRHAKNPKDTRIVTVVGRTFHTYTSNLSLVEVSIPHEHEIRALAADETYIYSASSRSILVWARGSKTLKVRLDNGHQADVRLLTRFGKSQLISVDEDNVLFNWNISEKEILNILNFDEYTFDISAVCQPLNYKDKVLLGSHQGPLQLWNIKTEQCLYKFTGWESNVTCLVQSPIEDVVAIGLEDGHVYVHNIKFDEVILKIYQEYGSITSMSFRLDNKPYLVTVSPVGHMMVWNVEKKRLATQIRNAHSGPITKCQFVRNEPLLVTSGTDNSIKIWTMDGSDGGGTLLTQRAGHSAPPSCIKFYGSKGFNLLSAGNDSTIKMFHLYSERLNRNMGTARYNPKSKRKRVSDSHKLPPITCFAAETAKEKQWDNIVACHKNTSLVTTWSYERCTMGEHMISQPTFDKHDVSATCVCITGCGNYVVIGYSNGIIFKYNIQSGAFRQFYEFEGSKDHKAHDGSVSGLAVDNLDIVLVSSGQDSRLRVWNFKTGAMLLDEAMPSPVIKLELHRDNNLLALAMENNEITIMDLETRTVVRSLSFKHNIIDMIFSSDSHWLIVSYSDKSVRTWDLALGKMIDAFRLTSQCTSLSMSSTCEFLATAQEDSLGINIWCNYTIYCPTALRAIDPDAEPPLLDLPFVRCDEQAADDTEELPLDRQLLDNPIEPEYLSPEQLHSDMITFSGLPPSRWKYLLSIDELRQKQLIEEEEKREKPMKVPFFIPVKDGLKPKLDEEKLKELNKAPEESETSLGLSKIQGLELLSPLAQNLIACNRSGDYKAFFDELKELGPSRTDVEIRSLATDVCGNNKPMLCFIDAIENALNRRVDYDLVSSWLALFLKAHSDIIQKDPEVRKRCRDLMVPTSCVWDELNTQFNRIFCALNFVRSSII